MLSHLYVPKWFRKLLTVLVIVELTRAGLDIAAHFRDEGWSRRPLPELACPGPHDEGELAELKALEVTLTK